MFSKTLLLKFHTRLEKAKTLVTVFVLGEKMRVTIWGHKVQGLIPFLPQILIRVCLSQLV